MVDHLPGWPIVEAIPNKEAVADVIYNKLILEHTCPNIPLSDNGKEYTNEILTFVMNSVMSNISLVPMCHSLQGKLKTSISSLKLQSENSAKKIWQVGIKF